MMVYVVRKQVWQLLGFISYLLLHSYDENIHVESLRPANLCLVTLLS